MPKGPSPEAIKSLIEQLKADGCRLFLVVNANNRIDMFAPDNMDIAGMLEHIAARIRDQDMTVVNVDEDLV